MTTRGLALECTGYELWFGSVPDLSQSRVLGPICLYHVQKMQSVERDDQPRPATLLVMLKLKNISTVRF